jgi:hypothetical protein
MTIGTMVMVTMTRDRGESAEFVLITNHNPEYSALERLFSFNFSFNRKCRSGAGPGEGTSI